MLYSPNKPLDPVLHSHDRVQYGFTLHQWVLCKKPCFLYALLKVHGELTVSRPCLLTFTGTWQTISGVAANMR